MPISYCMGVYHLSHSKDRESFHLYYHEESIAHYALNLLAALLLEVPFSILLIHSHLAFIVSPQVLCLKHFL